MRTVRLAVSLLALISVLWLGTVALDAQSDGSNDRDESANASDAAELGTIRVMTWKSATGRVSLCLYVRVDESTARRHCPERRRFDYEAARERSWMRTSEMQITADLTAWIRARKLSEWIEFELVLRHGEDGDEQRIRQDDWRLSWEGALLSAWEFSLPLRLNLRTGEELWSGIGLERNTPRLERGEEAPDFRLSVLGDDTRMLTLSETRASHQESNRGVTLLVFWSSWAPLAADTLNALGRIALEDGINVVGINVYQHQLSAAERLLEEVNYDLLHLADSSGEVARHYRVDGLPEMFLIDSDGVYRGVVRGAAPLSQIRRAIESARRSTQ